MSFLDDLILYVAPGFAAERERSRLLAEAYKQQRERGFDAASRSRRTAGWKATHRGPNEELRPAHKDLVSRARDLYMNNPSVQKAITDLTNYTIGGGIRPTFYEGKKKKVLEKAWKKYVVKPTCDFEGKMNFYGIQWMSMHSISMSGEVVIRVRRKSKGFPFALQVFEADIIDHQKDGIKYKDGSYDQLGVQYDSEGRVKGYWLYDRNPSDETFGYESSKYVAAIDSNGVPNVFHYFISHRPGQTRGYPLGVSGFIRLKDLDDFEDAELVRQKIASCHSVFISEPVDTSVTADNNSDELPERVSPGMIKRLSPGQSVSFGNPGTKEGYSDYTKDIKHSVAAAFHVPYELMTGDLSGANFSSLKAGFNPFHLNVERIQEHLIINQLCHNFYNLFLFGCEMMGLIKISDRDDPADEFEVSWTPPAIPMLDPVKEIAAIESAIRAGLQSWSDACRSRGYDPEQLLQEYIDDNKKLDAAKLMFTSDPRYDPNRVQPSDSKPVT